MARGMLTPELKAKAEELGISDFTTLKLRLIPYVHYCAMNNQRIEQNKVNDQECEVLNEWTEKGFISGDNIFQKFSVSKEFWAAMNDILWDSYVSTNI